MTKFLLNLESTDEKDPKKQEDILKLLEKNKQLLNDNKETVTKKMKDECDLCSG